MIVHDLGPDAVGAMTRVDLATATEEPPSAAAPFEFHGCLCGVASFKGRPPWELHTAGDELLHVLSGATRLTVRRNGADLVTDLGPGGLAVVPQGCWHNNDAPGGVTLLYMTPAEGNRHSWTDPGSNPGD